MAKDAYDENVSYPYGTTYFVDGLPVQPMVHYLLSRSASIDGLPATLYGVKNTPYSVTESLTADMHLRDLRYGNEILIPGSTLHFSLIDRAAEGYLASAQTDFSIARNRAIEGASRRAEALLLVALAETGKTVAMITGLIRRLFKWFSGILRSIRTFDIKELFSIGSDIWLEFRYGWRPLYGEIQNISKALDRSRKPGTSASHGVNVQDPTIISSNHYGSLYGKTYNIDADIEIKSNVVKSGFTYLLDTESLLADRLGFHFQSLLSTGWELIPFSFIIDWFVDLGGLINNLSSQAKITPHNSYDLTYVDYVITPKFREPNNYFALVDPLPTQYIYKEMNRTIPIYQHSYELQTSLDLSWDQSVDLLTIGSKIVSSIFNKHR